MDPKTGQENLNLKYAYMPSSAHGKEKERIPKLDLGPPAICLASRDNDTYKDDHENHKGKRVADSDASSEKEIVVLKGVYIESSNPTPYDNLITINHQPVYMQTPAHKDALLRDQVIRDEYQNGIKTGQLSHLQRTHDPRLRPLILVNKYYPHYRQVVDPIVPAPDNMPCSSTSQSGASSYYTCLSRTSSETDLVSRSTSATYHCEICARADAYEQEENIATQGSHNPNTNNTGKFKADKGNAGRRQQQHDTNKYLSLPSSSDSTNAQIPEEREYPKLQPSESNLFSSSCKGRRFPIKPTAPRTEQTGYNVEPPTTPPQFITRPVAAVHDNSSSATHQSSLRSSRRQQTQTTAPPSSIYTATTPPADFTPLLTTPPRYHNIEKSTAELLNLDTLVQPYDLLNGRDCIIHKIKTPSPPQIGPATSSSPQPPTPKAYFIRQCFVEDCNTYFQTKAYKLKDVIEMAESGSMTLVCERHEKKGLQGKMRSKFNEIKWDISERQ